MATSYNQQLSEAWAALGIKERKRPEEVFPRVTKEDFSKLKTDYVEKHGYTIKIPDIDQIIHLVPRAYKTDSEIKAEKREALARILASPAPEWAMKYSSIMTFLDDIQDTTSIIYPAISMLTRLAPKVMGRILPFLGWGMLGMDILNLAIGVGRLPMTGMGGKRLVCQHIRGNPFSKTARANRVDRLRNYKPGLGDVIQSLQVTDQLTGVGLSLGPVMGLATDAIFGAYRYMTGERVKISMDVPSPFDHEKVSSKLTQAASLINSQGQMFDEQTHFWSLTMAAVANRLFIPYAHDLDVIGSVENPMNIAVPAPFPKEQTTIDVIREFKLDVDKGVGWPFNGKTEISVDELSDHYLINTRDVVRDFLFRHRYDWYGYIVASFWDQVSPSIPIAFDPGGEMEIDDTPLTKVIFRMVKAPMLPTRFFTEGEARDFEDWINMRLEAYDRTPGILAIKDWLTAKGIPFIETWPTERTANADEIWPPGYTGEEYKSY